MGQRIESRAAIEKRIRTSLENLVFALGEAAGADRSSPFVVDEERAELRLALAKTEGGRPLVVRMPPWPWRGRSCLGTRRAGPCR